MSKYFKAIDRYAVGHANMMIKYRFIVVAICIAVAMGIAYGGKFLNFSSDYRVFFSGSNPELNTFESFQKTYTKNDNFFFVLEPKDGDVFTNQTLRAVEKLTEQSWHIPFVNRVDSLSNFQNSYNVGDDLVVEDLIYQAEGLSGSAIRKIRETALNEPLLADLLITKSGDATGINVVLQYPGNSLYEVPTAAAKARELKAAIETEFPDIDVSLTGFSMLNNAFAEAGYLDSIKLVPVMYAVLTFITLVALRSFLATFVVVGIVYLSMGVGMGAGGFGGVLLTPISNSAPIVILTLAIADCVHIFMTINMAMKRGLSRNEAIVESIRSNLMPVTITSLTTIVGFMALNLSDAPPYWHLGNMASAGIAAAWILSLTLLPAAISILPYRVKKKSKAALSEVYITKFSRFVSSNPKTLVSTCVLACLASLAFVPSIDLDDQWPDYFSKEIEFRNDTDQATTKFGLYPIEYSVPASGPGGISNREYLTKLEEFTSYLRGLDNVAHVYSVTDIIKRLNKNINNDKDEFYKIPQVDNEAAQYLLLYELSLPYGLDLNDRINIDKSATRVTVTLGKTSTSETKVFLNTADEWIAKNFPAYMKETRPTSAQVMFTYIADRNVQSMIAGTIIAIVLISIILIFALRSVRLGLLSLVPNALPIITAFGVWGVLVGTVGFSVAAVAAISLGIVVDDTVHFLTKYETARREKGLSPAESVEYSFQNVGLAIVINTFILVIGFLVMASSSFKINSDLGYLTVITIVAALILDFLLLPSLLLLLDKKKEPAMDEKTVSGTVSPGISISTTVGATLLFIAVIGASVSVPVIAQADEDKGYRISAMSDRSDRGFISSDVSLQMVLHNSTGNKATRDLQIKTLEVIDENLGDKSIVIFSEPNDIAGTALLSHAKILDADDQWLYLPTLKRVKRISSKNKSGPFVGSEFAFEDFTALELNKYSHEWVEEQACAELKCDVIKRIPQYEFSGYKNLLVWIDQNDHQVRKVEFYDRKGDLLKTLNLEDYRKYGSYWRAHALHMINHQTNKKTDLIYGDYAFSTDLSARDFEKGRLKQIR